MKAIVENRQIRSCLWIVNMFQRFGHLTLSELGKYWQYDNAISQGLPLPRRTFYNYRNTIFDVFGISIECQKSTNTYYIDMSENEQISSWLISSFNVGRLVMDSQEVKNRIVLADPPSGMLYFNTVVEAFRRNCCLMVTYQKFDDSEPYECHLQPYCLKLYEQRWYLLAVKDHGNHPLTFALDRMRRLELLPADLFMLSEDFCPQKYYQESFGVWTCEGDAPVIRVRAYGKERGYIRTLPLHASQHEVAVTDDYSDFEIRCHPTRDLLLHLLAHGRGLEVLEPADFRQAVAEEARECARRYE